MALISVTALVLTLGISGVTARGSDPSTCLSRDVVNVDVAIIGGGATGTYAALALKDAGKSVVVVEKAGVLGGQTDTWVDEETGIAFEYGVQRYQLDDITTSFLDRLGVAYDSEFPSPYNTTVYADFSTNKVWDFVPGHDFSGYLEQLQKYPWTVWTSKISEPVPADLYLSMDDFVVKYGLEDLIFTIFTEYGSPLLDYPTFSVLSETGLAVLSATQENTLRASDGNNQIYIAAEKLLESHVLYNSTVSQVHRNSSSVSLKVKTPAGQKLVEAKRLLVTIPTTATNMAPLDQDDEEKDIFSKFFGTGYYPGMIRLEPGTLPAGISYRNAAPDAQYNIPKGPAILFLSPSTIPNLYRYGYFSHELIPTEEAGKDAVESIKEFIETITNKTDVVVESLSVKSHSPFHSRLSAKDIKAGYWEKMYGLQGHRNTWYTGAQFLPGSSQLWNYTASLIPDIVAGL